MNKRLDQNAIREVLSFLFRHWRREKLLVVWVSLCMIVATAADLLMPVYSGRLVDAVAMHATARSLAIEGAGRAIAMMALLGVVLAVQRYIALAGIIRLTLRLMTRFAGEAFWRVQRFSTDWQANNFAGAIVRRITRGMWAVDTMDDILLLEMLPALLVLVGSSMLLGLRWPGGPYCGNRRRGLYRGRRFAFTVLRGAGGTAVECAGYTDWRSHGRCGFM